MSSSERPALLSEAWWELVLDAWNASAYTQSLARFGLASFETTDSGLPPVWVYWDSAGIAERRLRGTYDSPKFSASAANWMAFFNGDFTAAMGMMRMKIRFRGPVRRVIPYTGAFNNLARVSRPFV